MKNKNRRVSLEYRVQSDQWGEVRLLFRTDNKAFKEIEEKGLSWKRHFTSIQDMSKLRKWSNKILSSLKRFCLYLSPLTHSLPPSV